MNRLVFLIVATFLIVTPINGSFGAPAQKEVSTKKSKSASHTLTKQETEVIRLVNKERKKHGLGPLKLDRKVSSVARKKSQDMKTKKYFSHQSPTYGSLSDMLKKFKVPFKGAGENIAGGNQTAQEVMKAWMKSKGHRANILNKQYTHIGVGRVRGGPWGYYWTQVFLIR